MNNFSAAPVNTLLDSREVEKLEKNIAGLFVSIELEAI